MDSEAVQGGLEDHPEQPAVPGVPGHCLSPTQMSQSETTASLDEDDGVLPHTLVLDRPGTSMMFPASSTTVIIMISFPLVQGGRGDETHTAPAKGARRVYARGGRMCVSLVDTILYLPRRPR